MVVAGEWGCQCQIDITRMALQLTGGELFEEGCRP